MTGGWTVWINFASVAVASEEQGTPKQPEEQRGVDAGEEMMGLSAAEVKPDLPAVLGLFLFVFSCFVDRFILFFPCSSSSLAPPPPPFSSSVWYLLCPCVSYI